MNDQYGNVVPDDLVVLPTARDLTHEEATTILGLPWYEIGGFLCASNAALGDLDGTDFADVGLDPAGLEVLAVDDALKRYGGEIDGFYHA